MWKTSAPSGIQKIEQFGENVFTKNSARLYASKLRLFALSESYTQRAVQCTERKAKATHDIRSDSKARSNAKSHANATTLQKGRQKKKARQEKSKGELKETREAACSLDAKPRSAAHTDTLSAWPHLPACHPPLPRVRSTYKQPPSYLTHSSKRSSKPHDPPQQVKRDASPPIRFTTAEAAATRTSSGHPDTAHRHGRAAGIRRGRAPLPLLVRGCGGAGAAEAAASIARGERHGGGELELGAGGAAGLALHGAGGAGGEGAAAAGAGGRRGPGQRHHLRPPQRRARAGPRPGVPPLPPRAPQPALPPAPPPLPRPPVPPPPRLRHSLLLHVAPHPLRRAPRARQGGGRGHAGWGRRRDAAGRGGEARRGYPRHRAAAGPAVRAGGLQPPPQPRRDLGRAPHGRPRGGPEDAPAEEAGPARPAWRAAGAAGVGRDGARPFHRAGAGTRPREREAPLRRAQPGEGLHPDAGPLRRVQRAGRHPGEPDVAGDGDGAAGVGGVRADGAGPQRRGHGAADHGPAERAGVAGEHPLLPHGPRVPDGGEHVQRGAAVRERQVRHAAAAAQGDGQGGRRIRQVRPRRGLRLPLRPRHLHRRQDLRAGHRRRALPARRGRHGQDHLLHRHARQESTRRHRHRQAQAPTREAVGRGVPGDVRLWPSVSVRELPIDCWPPMMAEAAGGPTGCAHLLLLLPRDTES